MSVPPLEPASYDDPRALPENRVGEIVLRTLESHERHDQHWTLLATYADQEPVRAAPFDELALELGLLWA